MTHKKHEIAVFIENEEMLREAVYSLPQACDWFLSNSEGIITCVNDDNEKTECSSFIEAEKFYYPNI